MNVHKKGGIAFVVRSRIRVHSCSFAVLSLSLVCFGSGCSTPDLRPKSATPDHAYIQYWGAKDNGRLRLAVKDLIDVKGVVTSAGSEFLANSSPPAKRDAKCLAGARRRGVQIVGKTNTTELAVSVSGINEYYGTPKNPVSRRRLIPGGSSSGSAVAVATGTADVAFGTDTAGSIRIPAACCGIVGLKTTFGLIPLDGVYPIAPNHLDTIGPMGKDVAAVSQGMDLLRPGFRAQYQAAVAASPAPPQINVGRLYVNGTSPKIDQAIDEALAATGFKVVRLSREFAERWAQAQSDAATIAAVNAWIHDLRFQNEPGVTLRTKTVVAVGRLQYGDPYREALRRHAQWKREVNRLLQMVDFIALPTMQSLPPRVPMFGGTVAFEARVLGLQNTAAVNSAGVPAVALPVPIRDRAMPVTSLQLVGARRDEARLLNAARLVEKACREARG